MIDKRIADRVSVLAIMQNQWFKEPERVREIMTRSPELRRQLIARFLFAGCKSGRVLQQVFGTQLCRSIVWEEASREIGAVSSAAPPADLLHLHSVINDVRPDIVMVFGKIAEGALMQAAFRAAVPLDRLIVGPHPAARHDTILNRLELMRDQLDKKLKCHQVASHR